MDGTDTPLAQDIRRRIAQAGPMPVGRYMELCLAHPQHGYYVTRDPLGRSGDFTTAPEISQMFGELLGLWAASVWKLMGQPAPIHLVELGPGRGTMMMDALRALRIVASFLDVVQVHLVEINPALRAKQAQTLARASVPVTWHESIDTVPEGPCVILANEFFDALPVRQAIRLDDGWHERTVEIGSDGALRYGHAAQTIPRFDRLLPPRVRRAKPGAIFEWRDDEPMMKIARRLREQDGAALIIDYGHARSDVGDTFQAIAGHAYADPLEAPGEADLTAHVDFARVAHLARQAGLGVAGPITQGAFLHALGIDVRAQMLSAHAEHAPMIARQLRRLTHAEEMGALFKAICLSSPNLPPPAGF